MKKLTAIATAIVLFLSASSFTYKGPDNTNETNEKLTAVFKTNFPDATAASWKEVSGFYFVDFTQNGKTMGAAYDEDGNLKATSALITRAEVPEKLLQRAEGNYRNGRSGPLVLTVTYKGETTYFFDILTEKFVIRCIADSDGVITEDGRMALQKK